jgi:hypothetical protein
MKIPEFVRIRLSNWAAGKIAEDKPDFVIAPTGGEAYLKRWWIIPSNRFFNIYLHRFLKSDDDRALHDHPWWNCSILIQGEYIEWVPRSNYEMWPGNTPTRPYKRHEGHIYFRSARAAHRVELMPGEPKIDMKVYEDADFHYIFSEIPVTTLFITGPKIREWGFLCAQGWRSWREYTSVLQGEAKGSEIGRGCE